jgi:hypothetical protein
LPSRIPHSKTILNFDFLSNFVILLQKGRFAALLNYFLSSKVKATNRSLFIWRSCLVNWNGIAFFLKSYCESNNVLEVKSIYFQLCSSSNDCFIYFYFNRFFTYFGYRFFWLDFRGYLWYYQWFLIGNEKISNLLIRKWYIYRWERNKLKNLVGLFYNEHLITC